MAAVETVIPKVGGRVRLLQGPQRGQDGEVRKINEDQFSVTVELLLPKGGGGQTVQLPYEDLCKLA